MDNKISDYDEVKSEFIEMFNDKLIEIYGIDKTEPKWTVHGFSSASGRQCLVDVNV